MDAARDILHDIGHEIATLGYLAEAILTEASLPPLARRRAELIAQQTERLLALVDTTFSGERPAGSVAVEPLLAQLVAQADLAGPTHVTLTRNGALELEVDRTALWRILINLLNNAVHAAGPSGRVDVAITRRSPPTIEIADDGPGFGEALGQQSGQGLAAVARLSRACGARTRTAPRRPRGTRVEIIFSEQHVDGSGGAGHDHHRLR
ncbi:ATP-binding protein [Amycolatopsis sp. GM8]|uniref:ATP-binding protein n=1 Tax=Amycolatopsis sp. GM8 TaxID=2896530 RepID=UPI001F30742A|nr:ATP-binding protein [Amycolatopsis sp. GM8]